MERMEAGRWEFRFPTLCKMMPTVDAGLVSIARVGLQVADHERAALECRHQFAFDHLRWRQQSAGVGDEHLFVGPRNVGVYLTASIVELVLHDILLFGVDSRGTTIKAIVPSTKFWHRSGRKVVQ